MFILYAAVVVGWYQGSVSWWLALGAVGAAGKTVGAMGRLRRYKAWCAQWQAMSADGAPVRREKKHGRARLVVAALLFVAVPVCLPLVRGNEAIPDREAVIAALAWLWLGCGFYLVFRLAWALWGLFRRGVVRQAERSAGKEEAAPVGLLVGLPGSSPSRAEAARNLPEYAARLIKRESGAIAFKPY